MTGRGVTTRLVSVGFIEVDPERLAATNYARTPGVAQPFDYAWFTKAAERKDPCAGLVIPNRP